MAGGANDAKNALMPLSPTPDLSDLDTSERIELIVEWFYENFESPEDEHYYDSEDGVFIYPWGGPYDAREQIYDAFSDELTEEEIDIATTRLEKKAVDWSPNGRRVNPDRELNLEIKNRTRLTPPPGHAYLTDQDGNRLLTHNGAPIIVPVSEKKSEGSAQVIAALNQLQGIIEEYRRDRPSIGHNNPPEPIDGISSEIDELSLTVRKEANSQRPNKNVVQIAYEKFKSLSEIVKACIVYGSYKIGDKIFDSLSNNALENLYPHLNKVVEEIGKWIFSLM